MSFEQYVDFAAQTTVAAGGYTAGSGVLNVASTGSPFPSSPTFSVVIQDASTGAVKVLLRVLAVSSGTQWAVIAEGTDGNASASDPVYAVLSAVGLDSIRSDITRSGAYSGRTQQKNGNLHLASDVPIIGRDNGTSFDNFGPLYPLTDPTTPSWVWINQSTGSITANGPTLFLQGVASAGNSMQIRKYAAPATPWTVTALVVPILPRTNFAVCGICVRESSSGKIASAEVIYSGGTYFIGAEKWTNETTFNSSYSVTNYTAAPWMWLRIADDGTNRTVSFSYDGINFWQLLSVLRTDFLTANEIGFFVNSNQSNIAPAMSVLSWKVS